MDKTIDIYYIDAEQLAKETYKDFTFLKKHLTEDYESSKKENKIPLLNRILVITTTKEQTILSSNIDETIQLLREVEQT